MTVTVTLQQFVIAAETVTWLSYRLWTSLLFCTVEESCFRQFGYNTIMVVVLLRRRLTKTLTTNSSLSSVLLDCIVIIRRAFCVSYTLTGV